MKHRLSLEERCRIACERANRWKGTFCGVQFQYTPHYRIKFPIKIKPEPPAPLPTPAQRLKRAKVKRGKDRQSEVSRDFVTDNWATIESNELK